MRWRISFHVIKLYNQQKIHVINNQDVVCHLFTRNQGKVQMRNNKCNSEIVQYKLRSFITKCSNLPYKMFKSLKDELCYLVEIQYYGRVVFTLTYSEYFGSLSAN